MKTIALSAIAAIAIQPLFFFTWFFVPVLLSGASVTGHDLLEMATWVTFVATTFVALVGVPLFLVLRRYNRATWRSLACVGFLLPAIPVGLLSWPGYAGKGSSYGGNWHGHFVHYVLDGVPTVYGWLQYAEGTLIFGLHGLLGALVFFFVWRNSNSRT